MLDQFVTVINRYPLHQYLVNNRFLISRSDDSLGAEGSNVTRKVPRTGVAWGRVPADLSRTEDVRG